MTEDEFVLLRKEGGRTNQDQNPEVRLSEQKVRFAPLAFGGFCVILLS